MLTQEHLDAFIAKQAELSDLHGEMLSNLSESIDVTSELEAIRLQCHQLDIAIKRAKQDISIKRAKYDIATAASLKLCGFKGDF